MTSCVNEGMWNYTFGETNVLLFLFFFISLNINGRDQSQNPSFVLVTDKAPITPFKIILNQTVPQKDMSKLNSVYFVPASHTFCKTSTMQSGFRSVMRSSYMNL